MTTPCRYFALQGHITMGCLIALLLFHFSYSVDVQEDVYLRANLIVMEVIHWPRVMTKSTGGAVITAPGPPP